MPFDSDWDGLLVVACETIKSLFRLHLIYDIPFFLICFTPLLRRSVFQQHLLFSFNLHLSSVSGRQGVDSIHGVEA